MKRIIAGSSALALTASMVALFEGYRPISYLDPVGIPTVCYGHTEGVKLGQVKTQTECDALLKADLGKALKVVDANVKVKMPDTRRAALGSFVYNAGEGNFKRSTLLKLLNKGKTAQACEELTKWVYAKGRILPGLIKRRQAERDLCMEGL